MLGWKINLLFTVQKMSRPRLLFGVKLERGLGGTLGDKRLSVLRIYTKILDKEACQCEAIRIHPDWVKVVDFPMSLE